MSNDYENIVNLIVYKITLIDSNQLEIDNLEYYTNSKIELPDTVHKKNLVIYNLTTQKTISYELSSNYAICELNTLGEIALFNSSNDANGGTFTQSTNTIMLILIGSNVAMLIAVLLLAFVKKKGKIRLNYFCKNIKN